MFHGIVLPGPGLSRAKIRHADFRELFIHFFTSIIEQSSDFPSFIHLDFFQCSDPKL